MCWCTKIDKYEVWKLACIARCSWAACAFNRGSPRHALIHVISHIFSTCTYFRTETQDLSGSQIATNLGLLFPNYGQIHCIALCQVCGLSHVEHVCTLEFGDWFYCLLMCASILCTLRILRTLCTLCTGSWRVPCSPLHCALCQICASRVVPRWTRLYLLVIGFVLMCTLCTLRTLCALQGFEGSPLHCALCIVPSLLPPRRKAPLRGKWEASVRAIKPKTGVAAGSERCP